MKTTISLLFSLMALTSIWAETEPYDMDVYAGVFFDSGETIAVDMLDSIGTQGHNLDSRRFLSHYDSTACVTIDVPSDPRPGQNSPALVVNPAGLGIPDGFAMGEAVATELRWLTMVGIVELSDSAIEHIGVTIDDTITSVWQSTGGWWLSVFVHTSDGWGEGWTSGFSDGAEACDGLTAVIPPRISASVGGDRHAPRLNRPFSHTTGGKTGGSAVYRPNGTRVRFLAVESSSLIGTGTLPRGTTGAGVLVVIPPSGLQGRAKAFIR